MSTVADVLKRVRHYLNDAEASSDLWSDFDRPNEVGLIGLVTDELRQLEIDIRVSHEGYFGSTVDLDVTASVEAYPLPQDLVSLAMVERIKDRGGTVLETPISLYPLHRIGDRYTISRRQKIPTHYFLWGDQIYLVPTPDFSQTGFIRIWYVKRNTAFSQLSDTTPVPEEFVEILAIGAAIRARMKLDRPTSELKEHYNLLVRNLMNQVENRQIQEPTHVRYFDDDYFYQQGGIFFGLVGK